MRSWRAPLLLALLGAGAVSFAPAASAGGPYGPRGSQFSIAFPSAPKSSVNDLDITRALPKGAHAYAFWVSATNDLFGQEAPVPPTPSYIVIDAVMASKAGVSSELGLVRRIVRDKVTVNGLRGYEYIGSERSAVFNAGAKLPDPNAAEGFLALAKGNAVYLIYVIVRSRSQARSFLSSFKA